MDKLFKKISLATVIYVVVFLIDYVIELFRITESGNHVTILGLRIVTEMTPEELFTTFSLTWQVLITYIIFTIFFIVTSSLIGKFFNKK
jgi:hypothetical protein